MKNEKIPAHGHVVLLAGGRGQGVDAGRVAEGLVLGNEGGGGAVRDHVAAVQAAVVDQEGGKLAQRCKDL